MGWLQEDRGCTPGVSTAGSAPRRSARGVNEPRLAPLPAAIEPRCRALFCKLQQNYSHINNERLVLLRGRWQEPAVLLKDKCTLYLNQAAQMLTGVWPFY